MTPLEKSGGREHQTQKQKQLCQLFTHFLQASSLDRRKNKHE